MIATRLSCPPQPPGLPGPPQCQHDGAVCPAVQGCPQRVCLQRGDRWARVLTQQHGIWSLSKSASSTKMHIVGILIIGHKCYIYHLSLTAGLCEEAASGLLSKEVSAGEPRIAD